MKLGRGQIFFTAVMMHRFTLFSYDPILVPGYGFLPVLITIVVVFLFGFFYERLFEAVLNKHRTYLGSKKCKKMHSLKMNSKN